MDFPPMILHSEIEMERDLQEMQCSQCHHQFQNHPMLGLIKEMKGRFQGIDQISCGENFSPGRAKGYLIASLAVFPGLSELEAVDSNEALVNLQKEKVRDYLESVIFLDYLVSSQQSAGL